MAYKYDIPKSVEMAGMFEFEDKSFRGEIQKVMNNKDLNLSKKLQFFLPKANEQFSNK